MPGGSIDCDGDYLQHTGKSTSMLLLAWRAVLTYTPRSMTIQIEKLRADRLLGRKRGRD
jgi:hypothetical protein